MCAARFPYRIATKRRHENDLGRKSWTHLHIVSARSSQTISLHWNISLFGERVNVCVLVFVCAPPHALCPRTNDTDDEFCILMCRKGRLRTTHTRFYCQVWVTFHYHSAMGESGADSEGFAIYLFSLNKWNARPWNQFMKIFGTVTPEDISSIQYVRITMDCVRSTRLDSTQPGSAISHVPTVNNAWYDELDYY